MHEGTSQSAGFVAGAAALLLAAHRAAGVNATGAQMKGPIMSGAAPLTQLNSRCKAGGASSSHLWPVSIAGMKPARPERHAFSEALHS